MAFQFFSEADLKTVNGKTVVASEYPLWYTPRQLQDLEAEIRNKEATLEVGGVPKGYEGEYRESITRLKDHLKRMQDMTLVDNANNDKGEIGEFVKEAAKILKGEFPSQSLCERKLVDANQEYRKMTTPYLSIKGNDRAVEMAKACNVPISDDGKVSREGMVKMWKIGSKFLGEYANAEILRKG